MNNLNLIIGTCQIIGHRFKFLNSIGISVIAVAFIFVLSLSGCGDDTSEPSKENSFLPLKIGNNWTYNKTEFNHEGIEVESEINTITILKDSTYFGEKIFNPYDSKYPKESARFYYLMRNDGLYTLNLYYGETEPSLFLKFPVKKGDYFIFSHDTVKVIEVDVEYTVPAGTFKCIKYEKNSFVFKENRQRWICYFSHGIGQIATENYDKFLHDSLYLHSKTVLISYELK